MINSRTRVVATFLMLIAGTCSLFTPVQSQNSTPSRPDPREIPVPAIRTSVKPLPGVNDLVANPDLPDVMVMNDGRRVKTTADWRKRRVEMMRIIEYYFVGISPPAPGNVKGKELKSELLMGGKVKYRLIHLTFGPKESLSLDIGVFTPTAPKAVPAIIMPSGTPPGATALPRLPQGPHQGTGADALLDVGSVNDSRSAVQPITGRGTVAVPVSAESMAEKSPALAHGYAYVIFNNNDCGEDTTLRNPDGSWAFRTTRFYPAYPGYDWGLLAGWAWGVSRIVDYLQTDGSIDSKKLIVSGVSRTGKSALVAGAFDDRIAMVAPVASSGGGTPAFRFSGAEHGGNEGLSEMMKKYPNWFSPHLHEFWGQPEKLPFDQNWLMALAAPRPFIALEGLKDQNVNKNGVWHSWGGAKAAYELFGATDRLGVNWAERPHGMVEGDWDAMLAFADSYLLGKKTDRRFDQFPEGAAQP